MAAFIIWGLLIMTILALIGVTTYVAVAYLIVKKYTRSSGLLMDKIYKDLK